jgi:hypothetical protein
LEELGAVPLTTAQREELRGVLADEFSATGICADFEPNPRGILLERLIDRLGHL